MRLENDIWPVQLAADVIPPSMEEMSKPAAVATTVHEVDSENKHMIPLKGVSDAC